MKNLSYKNKLIIGWGVVAILLIIFLMLFYKSIILSSDNSLKSLTIKEYNIQFNKDKFEYSFDVKNDIITLNVIATPNDKKARTSISNTKLIEGNNTIKVIVTAENGQKKEYILNVYRKKVKLECQKDYTLNNDQCEKKELVSSAKLTYSCTASEVLNNGECIVYDSKAAEVTYTCDSGYTLYDKECKKTVTTSLTKYYSCPATYTADGDKCYRTLSLQPTTKYYCSNKNYSLIGDTCVYSFTTNAQPINGRFMCTHNTCSLRGQYCDCRSVLGASVEYECPKGYEMEGFLCVSRDVTEPLLVYDICPKGYILDNGSCSKVDTVVAKASIACPSGYSKSNDNLCKKEINRYKAPKKYSCDKDLVLGEDNNCYSIESLLPTKTEY